MITDMAYAMYESCISSCSSAGTVRPAPLFSSAALKASPSSSIRAAKWREANAGRLWASRGGCSTGKGTKVSARAVRAASGAIRDEDLRGRKKKRGARITLILSYLILLEVRDKTYLLFKI